jgi:ribosomal peptide maturation radical SAM protein 1
MKLLNFNLGNGDVLIIVPPFASLDKPSLGAHILQSCGRKAGFEVEVLYSNFILAAEIGEMNYEALCYTQIQEMIGERLFASTAFNLPPFGSDNFRDNMNNSWLDGEHNYISPRVNPPDIKSIEKNIAKWVEKVCEAIVQNNFKVVGCTNSFEQTSASIALLNKIKQTCPEIVTIIGGANCLGEMAEGIISLSPFIDYVFSGESEISFPAFLKDIQKGKYPSNRIIPGQPFPNLDEIPTPDFTEFYDQIKYWLPDSLIVESGNIWLTYESSRGCWWGEKHQCTFCGLNGETIKYRNKSEEHVLNELKKLLKNIPTKNICMTDNNMPYNYIKTLVPRLAYEIPDVHIFYQIKANQSLDNILSLKKAGIDIVQPGIESFSSSCLKLMNKGVTASQNINLLRYARSVGLALSWNILCAFPGDKLVEYYNMLDILPLLRHLHPPLGLSHLSIERFSQYFLHPNKYGISNIRYLDTYLAVFPCESDIKKIAYHFVADYESESKKHPDIMHKLKEEIRNWRNSWDSDSAPPTLALNDIGNDLYLLYDTRDLPGTQKIHILTHDKASVVLNSSELGSRDEIEWALEKKLIIEIDSEFIPLATARPDILQKFE